MQKKNNLQKSTSQNRLPSGQVYLYGRHPVLSAILNPKRKIYQILVTKNNEADLKKFAADNRLSLNSFIKIVDNEYIGNLFPHGSTHQGFALITSILNPISYNQFLDKIENLSSKDFPKLLVLDSLTDPQNIGAIIRSAAAFGFNNIVILDRNFPLMSPVLAKASSGMIEVVNLISIANLNNFLADIKKIGYWSVGLAGEAREDVSKVREYSPIALVVGSEGDGIRKLVKENCDLLVKIPMKENVESLNASTAAAIAMYEINKS